MGKAILQTREDLCTLALGVNSNILRISYSIYCGWCRQKTGPTASLQYKIVRSTTHNLVPMSTDFAVMAGTEYSDAVVPTAPEKEGVYPGEGMPNPLREECRA